MGAFRVPIEIANVQGQRFEAVEALVDTAATYTMVPRAVLQGLGVVPEERWPFTLADGRTVEYDVAQIQIRLDGRRRYTVVVFGDDGAQCLLGVVTLEELRLGVDPRLGVRSCNPTPRFSGAVESGWGSRLGICHFRIPAAASPDGRRKEGENATQSTFSQSRKYEILRVNGCLALLPSLPEPPATLPATCSNPAVKCRRVVYHKFNSVEEDVGGGPCGSRPPTRS